MSVSAAGATLQRGRGRMSSISTQHTVGSAEAFSKGSIKTGFYEERILTRQQYTGAVRAEALTNIKQIASQGVAENGE